MNDYIPFSNLTSICEIFSCYMRRLREVTGITWVVWTLVSPTHQKTATTCSSAISLTPLRKYLCYSPLRHLHSTDDAVFQLFGLFILRYQNLQETFPTSSPPSQHSQPGFGFLFYFFFFFLSTKVLHMCRPIVPPPATNDLTPLVSVSTG